MTPEFTRGTRPRAADLNRLASEAASAHPGFNGFLAADNGAGLSLRSPRRDPAPRTTARGAAGGEHLILRIARLSPRPLRPSGAWTPDGEAVQTGTSASPRILAIAANLAMPEDDADATVDTLCIGHRVHGFAADIGEESGEES